MKKKRLLTLMALAVMAVGVWADPTMTLTVKRGGTIVQNAVDMTMTSTDHWKLDNISLSKNTEYTFFATYNNGSDVSSLTSYITPTDDVNVTFYAKRITVSSTDKCIVACDGMTQSFCDSSWRLLARLTPNIGQTESNEVYLNLYDGGNQAYQQLSRNDNTPAAAVYYINPASKKMDGSAISIEGTVKLGNKPSFNPITAGVYKAVFKYDECTIEITKQDSYPLVISSAGAATLCLPYAVTLPEGLKAYTLCYNDTKKILEATEPTLTEGKIAANTPLLINGTPGSYDIELSGAATYTKENIDAKIFVRDIEPDDETNVLHGVLVPHYVRTAGSNYVLQNNGGNVGFYQIPAENTTYLINPFRAFINIPASEARALTIVYDDENTTGVKNVKSTMAEGSNEIYNLSGQRVGKDYKGVVIKNGRKMIQK